MALSPFHSTACFLFIEEKRWFWYGFLFLSLPLSLFSLHVSPTCNMFCVCDNLAVVCVKVWLALKTSPLPHSHTPLLKCSLLKPVFQHSHFAY